MNPEKNYCESFPVERPIQNDELEGELSPVPLLLHYEGPNPAKDLHYPKDGVTVRHIDFRPLERKSTFPSGGFALTKWLEKGEDGTEKLSHYHVKLYPELTASTAEFVNQRLKEAPVSDRGNKIQALTNAIPYIQICPDKEVTLKSKDSGRYFSIQKGAMNVPKNKIGKVQMFVDNRTSQPILRYFSEVTEVIDDRTEDEYRLMIVGALYDVDLHSIRQRLDFPVSEGVLSSALLSTIAKVEAVLRDK